MVEKLDDPDIDMNFAMLAARGMLQEIKKNTRHVRTPESRAYCHCARLQSLRVKVMLEETLKALLCQ